VSDSTTGKWAAQVKALWPVALMILLLAVSLYLLVLPACQSVEDASLRGTFHVNLKQLSLAMHAYHDEHRTLPPHAVFDNEGKPLLSWRVLVLPYLDQQDLYQQFRLDEPWDSPHNHKLLARMPAVYLHPARPAGEEPFATHCQVFVGPGAAFEGERGLRLLHDFPDGSANTILIAEAARAVPWTKPEDLPYAPDRPLPRLGGLFRGGVFYIAYADGSVQCFLPEPTGSNPPSPGPRASPAPAPSPSG
jgi:hypothetical protein